MKHMGIEIENELGISLHVDTIRKRAHEVGRVARKKSYMNKINRGKRLKFAKEMLEMPANFWKNVAWSDESKFNLFGSDDKVMAWRTPGEEFDSKCNYIFYGQARRWFSHGWGLFYPQKVGKLCVLDRIMDRFYYRDILEQNLQPSINDFKLGQRCIFMQMIMILNIPQN